MSAPLIAREWAMPSPATFDIPPIRSLIARYLRGISVDPFARNSTLATHRNDVDPTTGAPHHLDAGEFCTVLQRQGVVADVILFDPPYSLRQVKEVYTQVGKPLTGLEMSVEHSLVRDALAPLLRAGGVSISCGWNSQGFGKGRGFAIVEILLVAHGGPHNDTIVTVERKVQGAFQPTGGIL